MRLIEGDRGKLYLEIEHHERIAFYLVIGSAWTHRHQWPEIQRRVPKAWGIMMDLLDALRKRLV